MDEREELRRRRAGPRTNVADRLRQAGRLAQLGDVVRVLHEPDVEDEVRLERQAVLEAEADELDRELVRVGDRAELGEQPLAQLAQRQVGGVDDDVGFLADRLEQAALLGDRAGDPALVAERMRCRVSLKRRMRTSSRASRKTTRGRMPRPSRAPRIAASASIVSPARTSMTMATCANRSRSEDDELREVRQQLAGQVVDDGVAEVLEELGGGGLPAAGQAAQDDDGRLGGRRPRTRPAADRPPARSPARCAG